MHPAVPGKLLLCAQLGINGLRMRYTIVDIETRIDKGLVQAIYFPHADVLEEDAYSQVRERLRQEQGNDFFPLSFHIPISIAVGQVNDERVLTAVETVNENDYSEEAIVRTFWQRLERFSGTLVTFNGRGFDLPVLELHALKYSCQAHRYFSGKARNRYAEEGHFDLYDFLTNYGVHRLRGGFNLLAKMIGLPGKTEIDGSMVQQLWQEQRLGDIHRYCRHDVIQTY
ncbi:MAG: ribonuclease H-like domain-containing protein, partial [Deltaproteobacteria bacterium]|nr:ribonuclease H-like domain-containing protein [Deltaproteobacteria bacterium]